MPKKSFGSKAARVAELGSYPAFLALSAYRAIKKGGAKEFGKAAGKSALNIAKRGSYPLAAGMAIHKTVKQGGAKGLGKTALEIAKRGSYPLALGMSAHRYFKAKGRAAAAAQTGLMRGKKGGQYYIKNGKKIYVRG